MMTVNDMDADKLEKLKAMRLASPGHDALKTHPTPSPVASNGSYQAQKDAQIAKSVALNCAAQVTEAYGHIIAATDAAKTMTEAQVRGYLRSLKVTEYAENLKALTGQEADVDF